MKKKWKLKIFVKRKTIIKEEKGRGRKKKKNWSRENQAPFLEREMG